MNKKIMKDINRHIPFISVGWLRSLMPSEEEAEKITLTNYRQYLNQSPYFFKGEQLLNSSFTEKWTRRRLKKLYFKNPNKPILDYTYKDLL